MVASDIKYQFRTLDFFLFSFLMLSVQWKKSINHYIRKLFQRAYRWVLEGTDFGVLWSYMSLVARKPVFGVCDEVDSNWPAQLQ